MHPDFTQAPEQRRWTEPLGGLRRYLEARAYRLATAGAKEAQQGGEWKWSGGGWAWVVTFDGVLVAMRIRPDFRQVLRLARSDAMETFEERERWEAEVGDFLRQLGCEGWQRVHEQPEKGVAAQFIQLYDTEHAVGRTRCSDCGAEMDSMPIVKPPLCRSCVLGRRREILHGVRSTTPR